MILDLLEHRPVARVGSARDLGLLGPAHPSDAVVVGTAAAWTLEPRRPLLGLFGKELPLVHQLTLTRYTSSERAGSDSAATAAMAEPTPPTLPSELPVLPLRRTVAFPLTLQPLAVNRPVSIESVNRALGSDRMVLLLLQHSEADDPGPEDVHRVGTVGIVRQMAKAGGGINIIIEGIARVRADVVTRTGTSMRARITPMTETAERTIEVEAHVRRVHELIEKALSLATGLSEELRGVVMNIDDPLRLVYILATLIDIKPEEKQALLEENSLLRKLTSIEGALSREISLLEMKTKIESQAQQEMTDAQRQYYLRQQMKAIQQELGEGEGTEMQELRKRIEDAKLPESVHDVAMREVDRLGRMGNASPEYQMLRTYVDWLLDIPWSVTTADRLDPVAARQVLDADHYDLDKVKERIVEYLAVRKLKSQQTGQAAALEEATGAPSAGPSRVSGVPAAEPPPTPSAPTAGGQPPRSAVAMRGPILCFVGPPGVGKTSLGQSIARAMNRKFVRASLGGVRDEAEIRGHRRTYIGSMPGRILQALRRIESKNPVFMLDEIDKLTFDFHGDPASALLEVLDPEQNTEFRDNYLEVAYDLSQVFFITTANTLETIPGPLRDRMEIIFLSGYTESEKIAIANGYLIPRQIRENSLRESEVTFTDDSLRKIIREYTREAGVRNLERKIGAVCRKVATGIAEGKVKEAKITPVLVEEYLDHPIFQATEELNQRTSMPGVVPGLAWTPYGGDVLFVESTSMPGGKGFQVTGSIGNVMNESARAALSFVRSRAKQLGLDGDFFNHSDIHLHIPSGAQPKDGPSAGVTIATSLVSLISGRKAKPKNRMTV